MTERFYYRQTVHFGKQVPGLWQVKQRRQLPTDRIVAKVDSRVEAHILTCMLNKLTAEQIDRAMTAPMEGKNANG